MTDDSLQIVIVVIVHYYLSPCTAATEVYFRFG